jgi:hypothetical protein
MKAIIVLATAGVAALGIAATPAAAFHLSPDGNFTATGDTSATVNGAGITLPCHASLTGKVKSGVGYITGGTFTTSSGPPGQCESVTLGNLPWRVTARAATRLRLRNVTFQVAGITCGPSPIATSYKNSKATFTAVPMSGGVGGGCSISGSLTISPTLSIVP